MPQFIKVATTDELREQQSKLVELEGQKIALSRVDGTFYALSDASSRPALGAWLGVSILAGVSISAGPV